MNDQEFFMEKSWAEKLKEEYEKPYMKNLQAFLAREIAENRVIYPPPSQIFNAFCQTFFDKIKVVIVGQDPYHGPHQAHGLCFSVLPGIALPPSLQNIFKELHADLGIPIPQSGCLLSWAKQGVFLLNATLTVRKGEPKSHYGQGWETFTDAVIEKLVEKKDPMIFLLWGRSAKEKCEQVLNQKKHSHLILHAAHPSPYSATGFFGCRHFSQTNKFLEKAGQTPIDWEIK
jgi:uracil-DNA glycosylase